LVLPALLGWLTGVLAVVPPRPMAVGLGLSGLVAGGVVLTRRRSGAVGLTLVVCGVVALSAGAQGLIAERAALVQAAAAQERVTVQLVVQGEPKLLASDLGGAGQWLLEGQAGGVTVMAFLAADQTDDPIRAGHLITLRATATPTERSEAARVLLRQATLLGLDKPTGWRGVVFDLREGLRQQSQVLPADAAGLLPGITVGDRSGLSAELDQAMKLTSLTHITAVSGLHVAVVLGTVVGLLGLLGVPRLGRALVGGLVLAGFAVLVGPQPSVLRATLMGAVSLLALVSGRLRATMGALGAAVVVLVVVDPFMARSFGLVLSVVATAALITLATPLGRVLTRVMPARLAQAIALPMAAQLATAPIVVMFAGRVSLIGVLANVLAMPAVPVATVGGLFACMVGPASPVLAGLGLWPGGLAAWWVAQVARLGAAVPFASLTWPDGARGALALTAVTLTIVLLVWWAKRLRWMGRIGLGVGVILVVSLAGPAAHQFDRLASRAPPDDWLVAVCDVGQGTAVVLRAGPNSAVLVDAGPSGADVARCLDHLGVRQLEAVVITHFHADHVAGLADAVQGRSWGALVHGEPCGDLVAVSQSEDLATKAGAESITVPSDRQIHRAVVGRVELWLIPSRLTNQCQDAQRASPGQVSSPAGGEDSASNNAGLTVLAQVDGLAVWQLGDLEEAGQDALFWSSQALRQEQAATGGLVVVAHHGSARQSARLAEALVPEVAVFSVGADNPYGHPNQAAIDLFARARQWRTDQCGTVLLSGSVGALVTSTDSCPP